MLDILASYDCMQFQGKLMNLGKWWVLPLPDVRRCCNLSLYSSSRKTNDRNSKLWQKTSFCIWFRPVGFKFGLPNCLGFFFSKIWLCQSLNTMVIYHHVRYQKNLMIQSWENLVTVGQMDGQINRQTDKSDFIGHCSTNNDHPKM